MDCSDKNAQWPPLVARKIGPDRFQQWDNADSGSLGSRYVGKVLIDCKFRLAESQWGTLGTSNAPAGVIYIDLSFNQPKEHKLASATVQISLREYNSPSASAKGKKKDKLKAVASGLAVTDNFGPQMLTGKPTTQFGRSAYSLIPEFGAMGVNVGGVGLSGEKMVVYSSQWVLEGHQVSDHGEGGIYRTLEWKLSENDFTSQSQAHSNIVHTGLAIRHEAKPFYIKVKIKGKLRKVTDRLTSQFVFPPKSRKDQGTALTLLQLSSVHRTGQPLDSLARDLKDAMLQRNLRAVPREMPDSIPAASSGDGTTPMTLCPRPTEKLEMVDPAAPSAYSSTQKPVVTEMLSAALTSFAAVAEEGSVKNGDSTSPVAELSKDASEPELVREEVTETVEDRVQRLSAYPILVTLLHLLTRLLDLVEGAKGGTKDT